MIPMLQRGHDRHVVGFQHIHARGKHIGQLSFVYEHGCLPFAHCQLCAVFDGVAVAFKPPNHRIARLVQPSDNVYKFAAQKSKNHNILLGRRAVKYFHPKVRAPNLR